MANNKLSIANKIAKFNKVRKPGDMNYVANVTGYSYDMVTKTLRGERNNEVIVNTAYRLVKNRRASALA